MLLYMKGFIYSKEITRGEIKNSNEKLEHLALYYLFP